MRLQLNRSIVNNVAKKKLKKYFLTVYLVMKDKEKIIL